MKKIAKLFSNACIPVVLTMMTPGIQAQNTLILEQINHSFSEAATALPGERIYVQLDKLLYQPGETIWLAGYIRNSSELKSPGMSAVVHVALKDQTGRPVKSLKLLNENGRAQGDILLDESMPEGNYVLEAYTRWQRNGKNPYFFRKDIRVERLARPRVMGQVTYSKELYSGGDELQATIRLFDGYHQKLAGTDGQCLLTVAGDPVAEIPFQTDGAGYTEIAASLPDYLPGGGAQLQLVFEHQHILEELTYAIPYTTGKVEMMFFPEGGDLVDGQATRVAFLVRDVNGRPVDAAGSVLDEMGARMTDFESDYRGMGTFDLRPQPGKLYSAVITQPAGVTGTFPLPPSLESGMTLNVEVSESTATILIVTGVPQDVLLTADVRDSLCFSQRYHAESGEQKFEVDLGNFPAGVARFTLFDAAGHPQAERLAFVHYNHQMNIAMETRSSEGIEGKVKIDLQVTDHLGKPVTASLSMAVTDDMLLKASGLENASIIPGLWLLPDIRGPIVDPAACFDPANPQAQRGLDLVLMTHGWRHFTWQQILSGEPIAVQYKPELPVIEGYVYDDTIPNPVQNLRIRVADSKQKVRTDENGHFRLEGLDLSEPVTIAYKDIHGNWSEYLLTEYSDSVMIDIATSYVFKAGEENILETEENAQFMAGGTAAIRGRVTDAATGEPIPFASLQAEVNGRMINGCSAGEEGYYTLKPLPPGRIDVLVSSVGYSPYTIKGVLTGSQQIIRLDIEVEKHVAVVEELHIAEGSGQARTQVALEKDDEQRVSPLAADDRYFREPDTLPAVVVQTSTKTRKEEVMSKYELPTVVITYEEPLVPFEQTMTGRRMPKEEWDRLPRRTIDGAVSTTAGVFSMDGEAGNFRGARKEQTVYYVDGVRVIGDASVPALGIAEVAVYLGGIPAEYGDCRGGVVEITTRGPDMYLNMEPRSKKREVISLPQLPVYHRVREFPDFATGDQKAGAGESVPSTIFWAGDLQTDEQGRVSVEFMMNGGESDYRITVEGISGAGDPGHSELVITPGNKK